MAKLPKNWERRLVELAAIHGVTDFLLRGRLTAAENKVFFGILNKLGRPAARGSAVSAGRVATTAFRVGKTIALRHPVLTAGAIVYYTYKNREEIADLLEQGYEITKPVIDPITQRVTPVLEEAAQIAERVYPTGPGIRADPRLIDPIISRLGIERPKRKSSPFNKAVSKGMRAIKNSTSYGKKGKISPAKKAFSLVTKLASAKKKKKKAPKSGIRRKVWNALGRLR
jgi:hypothetical protein